ncbi:MAG: preprotein translocase subunit YajC [Pelagibacteraceae bacterium]|jgi:preprotein translocase subunit YajC|nr:preprotein translocase subunit YajC [Pelagibacteraceae bacterium]|tara:strand:- start:3206 stop:3484 length:279 start_codon:yes stop_codon:yes gene_type:complete
MEQLFVQLMPLFLIFAVFYFLLIRPQQRRVKEHKAMVAAIQRGDKILTSGGMKGKVIRVINDFDIEVEISQGVNVTIVKSTVSEVETVQPTK